MCADDATDVKQKWIYKQKWSSALVRLSVRLLYIYIRRQRYQHKTRIQKPVEPHKVDIFSSSRYLCIYMYMFVCAPTQKSTTCAQFRSDTFNKGIWKQMFWLHACECQKMQFGFVLLPSLFIFFLGTQAEAEVYAWLNFELCKNNDEIACEPFQVSFLYVYVFCI